MTSLPAFNSSQTYLAALHSSAQSSEEKKENFFNSIDHVLSRLKVFDTPLFSKDFQASLDLIHMNTSSFRLIKAVSTFIGAALSLLILSALSASMFLLLLSVLSGGLVGWYLPEVYIKDRVKTQQFLLATAVPTFLEQFHMLTSSSGYESFPQALKLIAPSFPGALGDELRNLMMLQPFLTETELLDRLTAICPHPLLKELAVSIRISSQYGTSLASKTESLVQSAQLMREEQTKDLANKTSGVLLGPLLVFHLPALLIIFLIPFIFVLQKGI